MLCGNTRKNQKIVLNCRTQTVFRFTSPTFSSKILRNEIVKNIWNLREKNKNNGKLGLVIFEKGLGF